jgi:ABC-2 type transport system ATP-binding protein
LLSVASISKRLGRRRVLVDVSFDCPAEKITCVCGANGAGKTTLLRIIAGVMEPDRGSIRLGGKAITGRHVAARRQMGYVPEGADPPGHLTVEELFALVAALKGAKLPESGLRERLGVDALAHLRIERLSLGERRRACLAAALVGDPAVLVLDEPTSGLDAGGARALADILCERRERGTAILIATHDAELVAELADLRLQLVDGRLVDGQSRNERAQR